MSDELDWVEIPMPSEAVRKIRQNSEIMHQILSYYDDKTLLKMQATFKEMGPMTALPILQE